jgi:3-hydroxyacyl-CoA dehydrogenase
LKWWLNASTSSSRCSKKWTNSAKAGTLVTTNTSGISVEQMIEGRSEDFQKHFCGTHFFKPAALPAVV